MRKSIGAATAALVVAGTAFMACGARRKTSGHVEQVYRHSHTHAVINCVQTEMHLRGRQGLEVIRRRPLDDRGGVQRQAQTISQ